MKMKLLQKRIKKQLDQGILSLDLDDFDRSYQYIQAVNSPEFDPALREQIKSVVLEIPSDEIDVTEIKEIQEQLLKICDPQFAILPEKLDIDYSFSDRKHVLELKKIVQSWKLENKVLAGLEISFTKDPPHPLELDKDAFIEAFSREVISGAQKGPLSSNSVAQALKNACKEVNSKGLYKIKYNQVLKFIRDEGLISVNAIIEENNITTAPIKPLIDDLYNNLQVTSELYSIQSKEGINYSMIKVTDHNIDLWKKFASEARGKVSGKYDNYVGIAGFGPSVDYYNNNNTEIWVAAATTKPVTSPNDIKIEDIEMVVPILTSANSPFTSHTGILRSACYSGPVHKGISMQLHSFAANVMSERYTDKKYMINLPAANMCNIILKSMEGKMQDVYLHNGLESDDYIKDFMIPDSEKGKTRIALDQKVGKMLFEQNKQIKSGRIAPFVINTDSEFTPFINFDYTLDVYDNKNGKRLITMGPKIGGGEFNWMFQHPYVFKDQSRTHLVTVNLDSLAGLEQWQNKDIEHSAHSESLNEMNLRQQSWISVSKKIEGMQPDVNFLQKFDDMGQKYPSNMIDVDHKSQDPIKLIGENLPSRKFSAKLKKTESVAESILSRRKDNENKSQSR